MVKIRKRLYFFYCAWIQRAALFLNANVYFGRYVARVPEGSIVFFPCRQATFSCGIAGIVAFKNKSPKSSGFNLELLEDLARQIETSSRQSAGQKDRWNDHYLGGGEAIEKLWQSVQAIKAEPQFFSVFSDEKAEKQIVYMTHHLLLINQAK